MRFQMAIWCAIVFLALCMSAQSQVNRHRFAELRELAEAAEAQSRLAQQIARYALSQEGR